MLEVVTERNQTLFKRTDHKKMKTETSSIQMFPALSLVAQMVKRLPASAEDARDTDLIPGLGRSPRGEHGNPLKYSCLENPKERGSWWAIVHQVTKSQM